MTSRKPTAAQRITAIDAYRGFVMFLMMAEVLHLSRVASDVPSDSLLNPLWEFLAYHQTHAEWTGCSLHDLIQPSFSFLVGVALPFSIASRIGSGQSRTRMILHAAWRALVLVLLGVFLRSVGKKQTYWTFEDTLSQIGLGYVPLFLVGLATVAPKSLLQNGSGASNVDSSGSTTDSRHGNGATGTLTWCVCAFAVLLVGYWAAFALYPLPGPDFDYPAVGVPADWPFLQSGFAAHWNKNSNLAWAFDTWFLSLFPRANNQAFTYNGGGYATLSFIPTLATMIAGLFAGELLRRTKPAQKLDVRRDPIANPENQPVQPTEATSSPWVTVIALIRAGIVCMLLGYVLDRFNLCPSVKRIWTPAWTLFSGGWCFLILAGFYASLDAVGLKGWSFPLRVIGANSIAAYCIAHLWGGFIIGTFKTNLGSDFFLHWGKAYEPLLQGSAVLLTYWLILFWMYHRRIFLRI